MADAQIRTNIPDDLHRRAKAAAALSGLQLKEYIAEAIAERVAKDEAARLAPKAAEVRDGDHSAQ
jgi:hypothetical protein